MVGDEAAGDGRAVLHRPRKVFRIKPPLPVAVRECARRDDDGHVLVAHEQIRTDGRADGRADKARRGLHVSQDDVDNDVQLVGPLHDAAVHHRDDHDGDGIHHRVQTALAEQVVDALHSRLADVSAEPRIDHVAEGVSLKNQAVDRSRDHAGGDARDGGRFLDRKAHDHQRRNEPQGIDVELAGKAA